MSGSESCRNRRVCIRNCGRYEKDYGVCKPMKNNGEYDMVKNIPKGVKRCTGYYWRHY